MNYSRSIDISHDHIDFGPQIPFLDSGGLILPIWPPKVYFFLLHVIFPMDGYITRPYWFWAPNSIFGLWRPIFTFSTPKRIFFLNTCKIFDWWIYHTTIDFAPQIPFLGSGGLFSSFWPLKVYIFFIYIKFPIDWWLTWLKLVKWKKNPL
jgi:hypothetical protein